MHFFQGSEFISLLAVGYAGYLIIKAGFQSVCLRLSLTGQSLYFPDASSWWLVISCYTKKEIFILDHFKGD